MGLLLQGDGFSTEETPVRDRAAAWTDAVAAAYFPLELDYRAPERFSGRLRRAEILDLGVSRLVSDPVSYRRRRRHLKTVADADYLITLPRRSAVSFSQLGREVVCAPGGMILERGDEPYRFSYERRTDLLVMKVPRDALAERLREPDRFCATIFDAATGAGALFRAMLAAVLEKGGGVDGPGAVVVRRQLLELLALTIDSAGSGGETGEGSTVRAAHLQRARAVIEARFRDPALTPRMVAEGCGVSLRYLHDLFRDEDDTVSARIRETRLVAARDALAERTDRRIVDIAYGNGFADHAQFTRLFRQRFGAPPSAFTPTASQRG